MSPMTLYGNYYLNCISQNPYRILGVTINTPKKDIIANANKFKAFLKVDKPIEASYDTIPGTNRVERSIELIISSEKALELPIDRIRCSLFWFVNKTSIDKIALNHVQSGNIEKAIDIWSKVESASSLINLVVSELIQQNWIKAVVYADRLFSKYAPSVCSFVDETLNLSKSELINLFLSTIAEDNYDVLKLLYHAFPKCYTFQELATGSKHRYLSDAESLEEDCIESQGKYPCLEFEKGACKEYFYFIDGKTLTEEEFYKYKDNFIFVGAPFNSNYELHRIYNREEIILPSELWFTCIRATLATPYIEKANAKIATYKAIPKGETEKRYKYAKSELLNSLHEIYSYLGSESSEYITLNNQIVKEALQCAIDYYNSSLEQDDIAREVKDFVWIVTTTAMPSSILRQRCKDNYDTLCEICSKLPPETVAYYHKLLKAILDKYRDEASTIQNASTFVRKCFPYLMSIKSVLGASDAYYQRMCTRVAENALEDIIIDYNEKSESLHDQLEKASGSNRNNIIKLIQEIMKSAVITMYHLKKLSLEPNFLQNRFNENYDIMLKQARNARVLGANSIIAILGGEVSEEVFNKELMKYNPDLRDEQGYFSSIKNLQDCFNYRKIFPNGKFTAQVISKMEEYEFLECSSLEDLQKFKIRYPNSKYDLDAKREEIAFKSCTTVEDYESYIAKFSTYRKEAEKRIDDLRFEKCQDRASYEHYLASYPNGGHRLEAQYKLDDIDYYACKSVADFEKYIKFHTNGRHILEAQKRLEEEYFWLLCIKKDSWKLYKEYLSKFPRGKYYSEAKTKSKSPKEKFNEWRSENGCLFTIIILLLIVFGIAGFTNGIIGIGYVFAAIGAIGFFGSIGKGDIGCGFRVASLGIGIISGAIGLGIISWGEELERRDKAKNAIESFPQNPSVSDYQQLFRNHGNQIDYKDKQDLLLRYFNASLDSCYCTLWNYSEGGYNSTMSGLGYLKKFSENCKDASFERKAEDKYTFLIDSLYNVAEKLKSFEGWDKYQNAVPSDEYRDSQEKKEASDTRWATDKSAWQTASELNNISSYQKYLELYPNGRYKYKAESKLIDLQVDATFAGNHGYLPEMDKTSHSGGATSYIKVHNNTSYTLTLLYSGKESKKLVLSPHSRGNLQLKNGSYRIAAFVSASNVQRYAGSETINGGSYEVEYYISTTTVPSYYKY